MRKILLVTGLLAGLAACVPTTNGGGGYSAGCCESGGSSKWIDPLDPIEEEIHPMPIAYTATGDEAQTLSDLGATTNPDGSVTVYEADMTGSDPGGL